MRTRALLLTVFFITCSINAQKVMEKILLKEGKTNSIKHNDLTIGTLLQVYDETSAPHLIGDVYLGVYNNDALISGFYIDKDEPANEYYTKIYNTYFLTFVIENNIKYLIIEQAHLGKAFALSSNKSSTLEDNDNLIEIEITDHIYEHGYDPSPEDENGTYYSNVHYNLKIKIKDLVKSVSFYSSEVNDVFAINIGGYRIEILSDKYKDTSAFIEMIIHKKEGG